MDSEYLKKNVLPALTEALTAMASEVPVDEVEFVGRYLCQYVQRQQQTQLRTQAEREGETQLAQFHKEEELRTRTEREREQPARTLKEKQQKLLLSLPQCTSKEEAFKAVCDFVESEMRVPAAYVAVREREGEREVLKYVVAGPHSSAVRGKKLFKPENTDEGEEGAPEHQGVSFDAFKLPQEEEKEEEEESEDAEGETEKKPKVPPSLSPLVVENVLRDKRVKCFGSFARLGAFVAIPSTYSSIDHDSACVLKEAEPTAEGEEGGEAEAEGEGESKPVVNNGPQWELVPRENAFLLAMDTIGKYRLFEKEEIAQAEEMCKALVSVCEAIDRSLSEKQLAFLNGAALKTLNEQVNDFAAKIGEAEAAAVAAAAAALVPPAPAEGSEGTEGTEGEPAEGSAAEPMDPAIAELLKTQKESAAALQTWSEGISRSALGLSLGSLSQCVLPLPAPALKLLSAIAFLCNDDVKELEDVCGDPHWETMRKILIPSLSGKIAGYSPTAELTLVSPRNAVAAIKTYIETHALADTGNYPSWLPVFASVLLPWLQKAIVARDAAIAYSLEAEKVSLEQ